MDAAANRTSAVGSPPDPRMTRTRRAPAPRRQSTPLVVRAATPDDLDTVVSLRLLLIAEERRSPLFARPRRNLAARVRALTARQLAATTEATFLATAGSTGIGLLRVTTSQGPRVMHPARYGFLTSAYVAATHRRKGILRQLLCAAEGWCRDQGLSEIRLHCTVENVEGNLAWQALGYADVEVVRRRVLSSTGGT